MKKLAITAAALAAGIVVQTQGFAQIATTASAGTATAAVDLESAAHENWRALMANNDVPAEGCFHASYPNFVWESVNCKFAQPRVHPVHSKPTNTAAQVAQVVGNSNDYVAQAQGLITQALGSFKITGVKSETGVAVDGGSGILGPNEYSLQINTNTSDPNQPSYPCRGHSGCASWQQFIYATDYAVKGEAAVFMQYWLLGWGPSACPLGNWIKSGMDCYTNSAQVAVPDLPITELGAMQLSAKVVAGGVDAVTFSYGGDAWASTGRDVVVDIGMVWNQAEFNVVGDAGGSEAIFNRGSTITVNLFLADGSNSAPACVANEGATGETNNLNLGPCQAAFILAPVIQFNEFLPNLYPLLPPIVGVAPPPPSP